MKFSTCVGVLFTAILALQMHAGQQESRGFAEKIKGAAKGAHRAWHRKRNRDIWEAIQKGRVSAVQIFLEDGFDIESKPWGLSPLHFAISHEQADIVRLLIDRGAGVNSIIGYNGGGRENWYAQGWSPLRFAVWLGNVEITRLLLRWGADMNAPIDQSGYTDMHADAVLKVCYPARDWTLLHHAAGSGNEGLVRLLIDSGVDVDAQDSRGYTPLGRALILVKVPYHIYPGAYEADWGWEAVTYKASTFAHQGRESIVKLLFEKHASLRCSPSSGSTSSSLDLSPLHLTLRQLVDSSALHLRTFGGYVVYSSLKNHRRSRTRKCKLEVSPSDKVAGYSRATEQARIKFLKRIAR